MEMDTASKRLFALPYMVEHLLRAVARSLAVVVCDQPGAMVGEGAAAGETESIAHGLFEGEEEGSGMFSWADTVRDWEEHAQLVGFERGVAQGKAEGKAEGISKGRSLLCKLAGRKFGAAVGEELTRRLGPVSDTEALEEVGVLILDCADGAELLARVRPHGGRTGNGMDEGEE